MAAAQLNTIGNLIGVKIDTGTEESHKTAENYQVSPLLIEIREEIMVNLTFLRGDRVGAREAIAMASIRIKCATFGSTICSHSGRLRR